MQDGTIGDDLVVKPLSAHVRDILYTRRNGNDDSVNPSGGGEPGILAEYIKSLEPHDDGTNRGHFELHDDYAFLDEDEELEDEDVFVGRPQNSLNGGPRQGRWIRKRGRRKRVKRDADDIDFDDDDDDNEVYEEEEEFIVDEEASSKIRPDLHVIYRRRNSHLQHPSDYRECTSR